MHPFCSRHATHLYHKINKAFVHLVFTASELEKLGYETPINANIMWPIKQYNACFINSNLKQINSNTLRERIEDFFKNNSIIEKRLREKNSLYNNDFPSFQCEQQFLDFILKK
jgi:hypothetical protein